MILHFVLLKENCERKQKFFFFLQLYSIMKIHSIYLNFHVSKTIKIYIFDSDLVWQMQLILVQG
jgi:hypothetical protein